MREIKYRAYHKRHRQMFVIFDNTNGKEWFLPNARDDFEVMQFTGIKDKNGKEVYEGDIVKHEVFGIKEITWGSSFDNDCLKGNAGFMYNKTMAFLHVNDSQEIEVIGNIFDNPNLLNKPASERRDEE